LENTAACGLPALRHWVAGLDLVFERLPAIDIRVLVLQPFASGAEQRRELIHKLGRASLQGVKRIVEGIDHRQQVNHPPAQFLGVAHRLRPRAFVGQLADHQFQAVEGRHHRRTQRWLRPAARRG
jgi:hypothetical protein